jgi:inosine-uridine nucleoside N-ribohydrolase
MYLTLFTCAIALFCLSAVSVSAYADTPREALPTVKIILDTDIGDDIDDAYALAALAAAPNCKLLGVTTTYGHTENRARLAAKLLKVMGHPDVPVHAGRASAPEVGRQYQWAKDYSGSNIKAEPAAEFLKTEIEKNPGEITLVAIGALTNLGDLVTKYPGIVSKIHRIVIMGGSVYSGYGTNASPQVEWNIKCDPTAAREVFACGAVITMAGLEATSTMQFDSEHQKRLFAIGTPTTDALAALTNLWGGGTPTQFDVMAVATALGHDFCDTDLIHVDVTDDGMTHKGVGATNAALLIHPRKEPFLEWYIEALTPGKK